MGPSALNSLFCNKAPKIPTNWRPDHSYLLAALIYNPVLLELFLRFIRPKSPVTKDSIITTQELSPTEIQCG